MINSFLVSLQNSATPPVNGASTVGNVLWPDPVAVKIYTGAPQLADELLFQGETDNLARFLLAIQYLWLVQESVCADKITQDDTRITYTDTQLKGQFIGETGWEQATTRALALLEDFSPLEYLTGDLLEIYRSSLSPTDKLAAVICYFGLRND